MGKWFKSNQGIGVMMTFLFTALLTYIQTTSWAHIKLRDGFKLGFFPTFAVLLLSVFSLVLIFDSRRNQAPDRLENLSFKYFVSTIIATFCCLVYFKIMTTAGFLLATPFFLLFSMYVLGIKSLRTLLTAAFLITGIVYIVFRLMGIELPTVYLIGI
jgi:hypothetical protein